MGRILFIFLMFFYSTSYADILIYSDKAEECESFYAEYERIGGNAERVSERDFLTDFFLLGSENIALWLESPQGVLFCSEKTKNEMSVNIKKLLMKSYLNNDFIWRLLFFSQHLNFFDISIIKREELDSVIYAYLEVLTVTNNWSVKYFPSTNQYLHCMYFQSVDKCNSLKKLAINEYSDYKNELDKHAECLWSPYPKSCPFLVGTKVERYQYSFPSYLHTTVDKESFTEKLGFLLRKKNYSKHKGAPNRASLKILKSIKLSNQSKEAWLNIEGVSLEHLLKIYWAIYPQLNKSKRQIAFNRVKKMSLEVESYKSENAFDYTQYDVDILTLLELAIECNQGDIRRAFYKANSYIASTDYKHFPFNGEGVFKSIMCNNKLRQN